MNDDEINNEVQNEEDSPNRERNQRFTKKEKEILYLLFQQYKNIIDIRCRKLSANRKNTYNKVRECWQTISNVYNTHPEIQTHRNVKQIQKFWLNSRLRKKFPPNTDSPVKCGENVTSVLDTENSVGTNEHLNLFEINSLSNEEDLQTQSLPGNIGYEENFKELVNSIEEISPDKLSLNDLLQFKTVPTTTHTTIEQIELAEKVSDPLIKPDETRNPSSLRKNSDSSNANKRLKSEHISPGISLESFKQKLIYFKLKEAELKIQEQEVRIEQLNVALDKSKEEFKFMKEKNALEIEELKTRIKIQSQKLKKKKI